MALVQDTTVRFLNPPQGQNFTFKLSKPINQLTIDDIKSQDAYVGFMNFAVNTIGEGVLSQGSPVNNPNHCYMWATDDSSLYSDINVVGHWCNPPAFPKGVYMRNILIYAPLTISNNGSFIKTDADSRIVIDVTPDDNTSMQKLSVGSDGRLVCWYSNDTQSENRVDNYFYIYPSVMFEINGTTYIFTQELTPRWDSFYINSILDQGFSSGNARVNFNNDSFHRLAYGWSVGATVNGEPFFTKFNAGDGRNRQITGYTINGHSLTFNINVSASNYHWRVSESLTDNAEQTITKQYYANTGFRFKIGGVWYKPIINGGVVTGYTDDMSVRSDWDDWTSAKGHNVPTTGGGGGDIKDKEHEMPLAYIGGNAGMVTFYEINKTGLASADDISDAISRFDISQIGKDVLRNLISFKAFAAISVNDTVDRQIKIAGIPLEDSGGNVLTGRVIGGVKPIDLFPTSGGVTIPTLYNDYRDYEPYTKIQMYVPFCGWFTLPSWCIGKKITGTMFTDLYNGTVKAVIYASQTVVAEVGGCCAYDIPFVADSTGAKASAVISSALTTAAAVGATVAMPNVATGIAAVSSAANLAATLNSNDTTLKGVLGDGSNLNGLLHVYIKISRPMSPNGSTTIPDSYKHEIGVPTMKELKLTAGDGYIQVMDAKVTGTMTAREKQMIVDGFRHGLNF